MKIGASREEQAVHIYQDPRGAGEGQLQGQQGEEPRGPAGHLHCDPHPGVPQRDLDVAGPTAGHEVRLSSGYPVAGHPPEAAATPQ